MNLQKFTILALREYTPKLALAKILDISTRTLYQYHDTAMLISDFESDYPSFTKYSYPITKAGLTKYQCWVIFSLILICRRIPREEVHLCLLQDINPKFSQQLSKQFFETIASGENYESQTICRTT